jgi:hypothetical protein
MKTIIKRTSKRNSKENNKTNKLKYGGNNSNKRFLTNEENEKVLLGIEAGRPSLLISYINDDNIDLNTEINYYNTEYKTTYLTELINSYRKYVNTPFFSLLSNNLISDIIHKFLSKNSNKLTKYEYFAAKKINEYLASEIANDLQQKDFEFILKYELDDHIKNKKFTTLIRDLLSKKIINDIIFDNITERNIKDYLADMSSDYPQETTDIMNRMASLLGGKLKKNLSNKSIVKSRK